MRRLFNRETGAYVLCGVLTVAVNYGVFWLALHRLGDRRALIANAIAFVTATAFACLTNKVFVFRSRSFAPSVFLRELALFFGGRIATFGIEEAGLWICRDLLRVGRFTLLGVGGITLSKILLSVVATTLNYLVSKFVTFRKN